MKNSDLRRIEIPLGATIRVTRTAGVEEIYVFRGTNPQGGIYEDENGNSHRDVGEYLELELKTEQGWAKI